MNAGRRYGADARTDEDGHLCPVRACKWRVPPDKLMCPGHWRLVPRPMQSAVWTTWQGGAGAGTAAHWAAMGAAMRAVNSALEAGR